MAGRFLVAPARSSEPGGADGIRYPGHGAVFAVLTAAGLLTSLRHTLGKPGAFDQEGLALLAACTVFYYPWIVLIPVVFRLERRHPLGGERWAARAAALALWSVPFTALSAPAMSLAFWRTMGLFGLGSGWPPGPVFLPRHLLTAQVLYWSAVAWGYTVRTQFVLRRQQEEAARLALEKARLEAGLRQAQLDAILARLNPHFLFNSLQNISALICQDPQAARRMVARLGDLLRAVLRRDAQAETSLAEELELARAYLEMEQIRLGGRLQTRIEAPVETLDALVPAFLLQPLVENAIRHGLQGGLRAGTVSVRAAAENGSLRIHVEDDGAGLPSPDPAALAPGVGLASTRRRLETMYADRHEFQVLPREGGGAEVRIRIPLRRAAAAGPGCEAGSGRHGGGGMA